MPEDISALRKVELHCHVDGLIDRALLRGLEARGRPNPIDLEDLSHVCPVGSFEDWTEAYLPFVDPHVSENAAFILETLEQHLLHLRTQNVVYTEIMLSSFLMQCPELDDQLELFHQFRLLGDRFESTGLQVEYLFTLGRATNRGRFDAKAERALAAAHLGYVCGVALAGDESAASVKSVADSFDQFHASGLKVEIHAGEWRGPDSVWDALEYGKPERLGHGLAVFDDPVLLEHVRDTGLHIEMCPTSNVVLAGVSSLAAHPIGRAVEEEMNVSVSTDDPGPLGITLESELRVVGNTFGFGPDVIRRLQSNALGARFAHELRVDDIEIE